MPDSTTEEILRRKIGDSGASVESKGMSPAKAFRLAVANACEDASGLEATLSGCSEEPCEIAAITGAISGSHLILLLQGQERSRGLALIDQQVISGVVEHLTTGRVAPEKAAERPPTRTDAMMLSELLEKILASMEQELEKALDAPPIKGFRFLSVLEDERAVGMAIEEIPYRALTLQIDLAKGAKSGEIRLFFPLNATYESDAGASDYLKWKANWQDHILQAVAPIEAVLHRIRMSVSDVSDLKIGSVIHVPLAMVGAVTLEGLNNEAVVTGKLGQMAGRRAVRINTDIAFGTAPARQSAEFTSPIQSKVIERPLSAGAAVPEAATTTPIATESSDDLATSALDTPTGNVELSA